MIPMSLDSPAPKRTHWLRRVASLACAAVAAFALHPGMAHAATKKPAASAADEVPVANFTGFNDLGAYLARTLKPELVEAIRRENLVVFAVTSAAETSPRACFAMVGLTEQPPQGRNPRFPKTTFGSYATRKAANWNADDCQADRFRSAIDSLNSEPLDALLDAKKLAWTRATGGTRKAQAPDPTIYWRSLSADEELDHDVVFAAVSDHGLSRAVDYRHVQTRVVSRSAEFDDGSGMCVAFAGLTARQPDGRNARWPGHWVSYFRLYDRGDSTKRDCEQGAAQDAVNGLMQEPWNEKGLLRQFSRSAEDGIALPNAKKLAAVARERQAQAPRPAVAVKTAARNYTSCSNQCFNGDCVRTFPDGRKERWHAPRRYDPLKGDWVWDTNSCGG